ncbi:MAG TPA: two-component regulator propeller domain-containing protein, partial [Telluria sp.]|nr:two-component regulator propeller domain-containing protein [Telluria sp.]
MLGVLLAALCTAAAAGPARSLRFERIGVEQGLSQESVLNVLQDSSGFMWFGTQAGLNRFDGYRMTVYRNDPDDPASIPDNFVLTSHEDAQGRLWFGTKGGLARFDEATHKFIRYLPGTPGPASSGNRGITAIASDGKGGLWLGTGNGLQHFDPDTGVFRPLRHDPANPASLADDRVNTLAMDGQGGLWVGTAAGLDRLGKDGRFEHFRVDPAGDARRNTIVSLSMGPRDTLWIGTAAGLDAWRLDEGAPQRRQLGAPEGMSGGRITSLYHDAGGTLWVGTELDGLKWRDPSTGKFVSYRNQPLDRHSLSDSQV